MTRPAHPTTPLRITREALEAVRRYAAAAAPEECCGALEATVAGSVDPIERIDRAVPVENEADVRTRRYRIGPESVRALDHSASGAGRQLVGFYHSHPRGQSRPSLLDIECAWPWYVLLIAGRDGVRAWRLREDRLGFDEVPLVVEQPDLVEARA